MVINHRSTLLGAVFVLSLIILIWLVPRIFALYHQVEGGILLDEVLQQSTTRSALHCPLEPLSDDASRVKVEAAVDHFNNALRYNPSLVQANLLRGRAYCWLGELDKAVTSYDMYTRLKPDNPIGHLELALAYQTQLIQSAISGEEDGIEQISDQELQKKALAEWDLTGIETEHIVTSANYAYSTGEFSNALIWYRAAMSMLPDKSIENSVLFRWGISVIMSGFSELPKDSESSIMLHNLDESLLIQGEDLQWNRSAPNWDLAYGDPLSKFPSSDHEIGVMWWQGTAIAVVYVDQPGEYRIDLRVQDLNNDQTSLQIEQNFTPLDKLTIREGDQTWHEFGTNTSLNTGFNIIGVTLLEDNSDLFVDWIRLKKSIE